jgi:hypothetical protein
MFLRVDVTKQQSAKTKQQPPVTGYAVQRKNRIHHVSESGFTHVITGNC